FPTIHYNYHGSNEYEGLTNMITTRNKRWRLPLLLLFIIILLAGLALASTASAQVKTYYWERLDVDVQVQENGDLLVTERQVLNFSGAPFSFGFREIPTGNNGNNDGVDNFSVQEGDIQYEESSSREPYTFRAISS